MGTRLKKGFLFLLLLSVLGQVAHGDNTIIYTNVSITGLPSGSLITLQVGPAYTSQVFNITGTNTIISLNITPANAALYGNKIPFTWSGNAGAAIQYRGVTYSYCTTSASNALYCGTGYTYPTTLAYNSLTTLRFFPYLNLTAYYLSEAAYFKSIGVSANSVIVTSLNQAAINALLATNSTGSNAIIDRVLVRNSIATPAYGTIRSYNSVLAGNYLPAGNVIRYAIFDSSSGVLSITTANVAKAVPNQLNVNGYPIPQNTVSIIHILVINGHYGLTGSNTYPVTVSFNGNTIGNNPLTYTMNVLQGSTVLYSNTVTASNFAKTLSYNIPVTSNSLVEFVTDGNGNYTSDLADSGSVTIPTNILYYLPVNVINTQSSAFQANAQIPVTINAISLQPYITKSLNNTEWFFANGTVIPSWMEGNTLNEQALANSLYSSANVLFWLRIANSVNLFPASMTSNYVIYLGIVGNTPSTSNMLFSYPNTGEAPQLSCVDPTTTNTCVGIAGATSYGYWDNGNSIFPFYDNFAGTTLNGKWTPGAQWNGIVNNGLGIDCTSGSTCASSNIYATYPPSAANVVYDALYKYINANPASIEVGGSQTTTYGGTTNRPFLQKGYSSMWLFGSSQSSHIYLETTTPTDLGSVSKTTSTNTIKMLGLNWTNSGNLNITYGYSSWFKISNTLYTPLSANYLYIGTTDKVAQNNLDGYVYYIRTRLLPPNSIMPTITFQTIQQTSTATSVSISGPSNSIADVGQWESFTATVSNGNGSPYTYNWIGVNSITKVQVANTLYTGSTSTANTLLWQVTSAEVANSPIAWNVIVTDASATYNSVYSSTYGVNSIPIAGLLTESNTVIYTGGSSLLTSAGSSGSGALTINWFSNGACSQPSYATGTTNTVSPTVSTTYSYNVVDSTSTPYSVCSASNTVSMYSCGFTTSTYNIVFGSISAGTNIATTIGVTITNGGTGTSNILVQGEPSYTGFVGWNGITNSQYGFGLSNTVWSATASKAWASATPLTSSLVDTLMPVSASGGTATIYWGQQIPLYQPPQTYNGIIQLSSSC